MSRDASAPPDKCVCSLGGGPWVHCTEAANLTLPVRVWACNECGRHHWRCADQNGWHIQLQSKCHPRIPYENCPVCLQFACVPMASAAAPSPSPVPSASLGAPGTPALFFVATAKTPERVIAETKNNGMSIYTGLYRAGEPIPTSWPVFDFARRTAKECKKPAYVYAMLQTGVWRCVAKITTQDDYCMKIY